MNRSLQRDSMNKIILFSLVLLYTTNIFANENLEIKSGSYLANDTPKLYKAIQSKEYKALSNLLKSGEDPCQRMRYKYKHVMNTATAFDYAIRTGDNKIVKEFLPYIKNLTIPCSLKPSLFYAISTDNISMMQFLIQNGADINYESKYAPQNTALEESLMLDKIQSAQFLIENGAKMPVESQVKILKHAVTTLRIDTIRFLINKKMDLNYQNKNGNTILHIIAKGKIDKNVEGLQKLCDSEYVQKIPGYRESIQKTIDELKSKWDNYPKIIQLLVDNGASYKQKNKGGKTPYTLAKENNTEIMLDFFKNMK